jgi:hypothetical protein
MNFIELKLVGLGFLGIENCGSVTINTNSIIYVKECEKHYLIKTKLGWEYFRITKEEYNDKISQLFKSGTVELSFGKMFINDIEAFWNVEDEYFMQTSWSDVKVAITKKDYDKIVEGFKTIEEDSKVKEFTKVGRCYSCKEGLTFTGFDKDSLQAIYKCKSCGNVYKV